MRLTSVSRMPAAVGGGRRSLRHAVAVITIVATAMAVAACGGTASATKSAGPEKRDLVVAAVPGEGAAGLCIAQEKGLFAKQGLHVTIQPVTSSSTVIPAMLHGSVDVASGQYTSYIAADAPNSETPALLSTALSSYGVTPAQVHLAVIPFPAMPAALAAGRVDAAYEIEPYLTEPVKQHGVQDLADIDNGATQDFPIAGYGVLASWAAKYPRTAAAFAKAIEQANAIAATNLATLQHTFTTQLHLSAD